MSFLSRQPNGLLCRFSTVVDCPTAWNMTEDDYINLCAERARKEAKEVIKGYLRPFEEVKESFVPGNMGKREFKKVLKEMGDKP